MNRRPGRIDTDYFVLVEDDWDIVLEFDAEYTIATITEHGEFYRSSGLEDWRFQRCTNSRIREINEP
jgi:hypothetical protein